MIFKFLIKPCFSQGFLILYLFKPAYKAIVYKSLTKKIMKKIFIVIFFASLFASNVNAQIRRAADSTQNVVSNSSKRTQRLETMNSLNLTKDQMGRLKEFRRNMKQKKDAITNDQTLTNEQQQSKLKDLRKEQKEKLNSILTPEQMEQLKEQRKNSKMQKNNMGQSDSTGSVLGN